MLWNKGNNELEDRISDREVRVPAGVAFLFMGLLLAYLCITVGLQADIASTAYVYDTFLNIALNEYSEGIVTDWIRDGMVSPASDEGIVLGVMLIVLSVGLFLMASTMGPLLTNEKKGQRTPDIVVIGKLLVGEVKIKQLNWAKFNVILMGTFVILFDNILDSFYKAKIDPSASFIEKVAVYVAVFLTVFLLNSGLSEIALTFSLRWIYSGGSLLIGIGTELFGQPTRKRKTNKPEQTVPDNIDGQLAQMFKPPTPPKARTTTVHEGGKGKVRTNRPAPPGDDPSRIMSDW